MMNAKSELILRQQHLFSRRILLINPPVDDLISHLKHCQCDIWTWHYAEHRALQQRGFHSIFDICMPNLENYQQVIIFNPKSKIRLAYVLNVLSQHCAIDTEIFLVGEKKAGIEGAAKLLQQYGKAVKIDNARHCQLWQMYLQIQRDVVLDDWIKHYPVVCGDKTLKISAWAGVFSQNSLDVGTAQLLPYLPQVQAGKIADFGCGAGVIASYLATLQPESQIIAYDVDAFALASTRLSAENNHLKNIEVHAVTGIADIATDFNAIVSNPPFHQGVETDYVVSEQLCLQAKSHLCPYGEVWIVANQFLNYMQWLQQQFNHCKTKTQQQGFKVFYAHNTR